LFLAGWQRGRIFKEQSCEFVALVGRHIPRRFWFHAHEPCSSAKIR
jgi:hypothetical protein